MKTVHENIELLIEKTLNNEITKEELEELQEHMNECEECREKYEAAVKIETGIKDAADKEYEDLPASFAQQSGEIVTGVSDRKMKKNTIAVAVIAGILIIGTAAYAMLRDNGAVTNTNTDATGGENDAVSSDETEDLTEGKIIENYNGHKGWTYNTETGIITREPEKKQKDGGEIANLDKIKDKERAFDTSWFRTPNQGLNHYFYFEFETEEDLAKFFPKYKKEPKVRNGYIITITKSDLEKAIDKYSNLDFKYSKITTIKTEDRLSVGQVFATTKAAQKELLK